MKHRIKKLITDSLLLALLVLGAAGSAHAGPFDTCDFTLEIHDQRYGFVWKPSGAHRQQAVLVLPSRFTGFVPGTHNLVVRSVTLYRADNLSKIGPMIMKSNGVCVSGGGHECLDRPTFAHPTLSGGGLSRRYGKIRIRVVTNVENHVHCTEAFDPKNRQD
jgi:hypothetical protein